MKYTQHPLSAAFPAMLADEYQALKDSITNIGVQNPITLFDGMVIDGWHRYQAATSLGMECPTAELHDTDPRDYVLAQNKNRRHITSAQLAMATTAVYAWAPAGKPKLHTECAVKTTSEMAGIAGVHRNTIVQARSVQAKAAPEVQAAVKSGAIGLPKAVAISKMPMAEQAAAINKPLPKQEPVNDDGMLTSDELVAEMQETQAENAQLQERVELMAKDDKAAEISKLLTRINGLEGRLHQAMNQIKASEDTAKVHAALIHKLRKLLNVEGHKAIYAAVAALVAERAEA